jgi:signal transduction histidine kinase
VKRRCALNGLMVVTVRTRVGLGLRTKRLRIPVLPGVLQINTEPQWRAIDLIHGR